MKLLPAFATAFIAAALLSACGDDDGPSQPSPAPATTTATATSTATIEPTATTQPAPPTPTDTPEPTETPEGPEMGEIGPDAVVDPFELINQMYDDCPVEDFEACWDQIVEDSGSREEAKAFWLEYDAFLVDFEEHGAVDYGAVSSPQFNMARPEPVFLNGEPELMYLGALAPEGWQSDAGYAGLPEFATGFVEYGSLVEATAEGDSQTFALEVPILECRACQPLGYLNFELRFEAGSLAGSTLLPMTEEPSIR